MRAILAILIATACSSKEPASTSGSAAGSSAYQPLGKKPADARRPTPPPGIAAKALAVGAKAPAIELPNAGDPSGATWRLADALDKHARVMLVFYRGDW